MLAMENGPPGLSGTSHAIVALAANGKTWLKAPYSWAGCSDCIIYFFKGRQDSLLKWKVLKLTFKIISKF